MSDHCQVSQQNGQSDPPDHFWGEEQFPCADLHFYLLCFSRELPTYFLLPPSAPCPSFLPPPAPAGSPCPPEYCTPTEQLGAGEVLGLFPLTTRFYLPQSLEQLIAASREDLSLCPGLGPQKVRAWGNGLEGLRAGGSPKEMGLQIPKF